MSRDNVSAHYDFSIFRDLRKSQALTIADVAEQSGISTAVISRIERNQASPEINTLYRLGKVLGITATDLLGLSESKHPQVTAAQHYTSGSFNFKHIKYQNFQCFLGSALAGASVSRPEVHHNDIETCWVISGSVEMNINGEIHQLKEGDAIQFDGVLKHTYKAMKETKILLLHLPKAKGL